MNRWPFSGCQNDSAELAPNGLSGRAEVPFWQDVPTIVTVGSGDRSKTLKFRPDQASACLRRLIHTCRALVDLPCNSLGYLPAERKQPSLVENDGKLISGNSMCATHNL
jgi:hypothetical protein